jgi:hypothetical protein
MGRTHRKSNECGNEVHIYTQRTNVCHVKSSVHKTQMFLARNHCELLAASLAKVQRYFIHTWHHLIGCCSSNSSGTNARGPRFESWSGHQLSWKIFCNFPQFLKANARIVRRLRKGSFLSDLFELLSRLGSYHLMLSVIPTYLPN